MTMLTTYADVLGSHKISVPDHLVEDAEVPVLCGPQRQGDVAWWPVNPAEVCGELAPIGKQGVAVVVGENGGNTHRLIGDATWVPASQNDPASTLLGWMSVADGATAFLIHDDEHGANGIGTGTYRVNRKIEQADVIRRVAD